MKGRTRGVAGAKRAKANREETLALRAVRKAKEAVRAPVVIDQTALAPRRSRGSTEKEWGNGPVTPGQPGHLPFDRQTTDRMAAIGRSFERSELPPPVLPQLLPNPPAHSSMYRPPKAMSAETKEKLRAIRPTKPRDVGDRVAVLLRECADLGAVFKCGSKYLGETVKALHKKYDHLDNGRKRMTIGNRMRALYKKTPKLFDK